MQVVRDEGELKRYLEEVYAPLEERPSILLDRFLEGAIELDVDALSDGQEVMVAGIMEHVERAGVHSGDSATLLPPVHVPEEALKKVRDYTRRLALTLGVRGLLNVQYAVVGEEVYVLEANPRASRTVPFVSKAIGVPLAKLAALIAVGKTLKELGVRDLDPVPPYYAAKEVVIPWIKFPGVIPELGPEMRSTGESMGIDQDPYLAYYKAELGAGQRLPLLGRVRFIGEGLEDLKALYREAGFALTEGQDYDLLISLVPDPELRRAVERGLPFITTREGAWWSLKAILRARESGLRVQSLQDWHQKAPRG